MLALAPAGALLSRAQRSQNSVVAGTTFGKVRGIEMNGIKIFKGIPYGASTAGANRFMPAANRH